MHNIIPVYYYPTKKIILDDDQAFLQSIALKLQNKSYLTLHSTTQAFSYFTKNIPEKLLSFQLLYEHQSIQYKKILLNTPAHEISVLIVDYYMPEMNGIEFLKNTKHLPCKKLLITSEKDFSIAVDAFNQGIIDGYIRKSDQDFIVSLQKMILDLEWKFFIEKSNEFYYLHKIAAEYLKNTAVIQKFHQFIADNSIEKFCLIDTQGDFLAINSQEHLKYFILRSKKQLRELLLVAKEDGASYETINKIESGEAIPFFYEKKFWEIPASEWDGYLFPTETISSDGEILRVIV